MRPVVGSLALLLVTVLAAAALVSWFSALTSSNMMDRRVRAEAPPAPGAPVPALDLALPVGAHPQLAEWAQRLSTSVGVPALALQAYGYAAASQAAARPQCSLGWTTLAGIGSVESRHGSYGGARLDLAGTARPAIIGIPLDGSPGVQEIADTDEGVLDGDTAVDRAVGPMQFIPETWQRWGADANGDGVADPNNVNDAAMAAARYLCSTGADMGSADGWRSALFTYNRSAVYANQVLQNAAGYAVGVVE
ncbi:lytic murein transglycosylase [Rhodococcus sp. X156]|uniref:lytic transglycosylase domain-containing protein n=1 Tax=Rhodococcus sp. X156 TaxID=2499145 RepID=UPI000FDB9CB8|nr:lytic murein transglycosylase [Rhodococcus sp. X156]